MRIDRIINKAKSLGINTGNGTKPEQLESIANNLGIEENNLDLIENKLDGMLSDNEEFLDTPKNTNNEDVVTSSRRNVMNRKNTSDSLKNASNERTQNKVKDASDKMEEINKSKEPVEDVKAENKPPKVNTMKKVGRTGADAAMKIGRATAKGVSSLVTLIMANPLIAGAVAIVILILLMVLIFAATEKDFTNGYFDSACNYNNTTVTYESSIISLKNFVVGATYHYMQEVENDEEGFNDSQIKALMIAIKTTTLAVGNYNSTTKSVSMEYDVDYTPVNEIPSDIKTNLEENYGDIERFLYISNSYKDVITTLNRSSKLDLSKNTIEKIRKSNGSYNSILKNVYGSNSTSTASSINASNPTIFVGDSRTNGIKLAVSDVNDNNTVAKDAEGYNWFVSSAISSIDSKLTEETSYNIVIWLGVNDYGNANTYFNKYKELAEGKWSNHTIYVVQVGPLDKNKRQDWNEVNNFNDTMSSLISSSGLSNLIYLDLGLDQDSVSFQEDGVHYTSDSYQEIYNLIMGSTGTSGGKRKLYDLGDYCEFHENTGSCDIGWWYPVGSENPTSGNIYGGDPMFLDFDKSDFGYRDPSIGSSSWHNGVDLNIRGNIGIPIIATKSGTITVADYDSSRHSHDCYNGVGGVCDHGTRDCYGCGNYVVIDHGDGTTSKYCHLSHVDVNVGETVAQGQLIGKSGSTGMSRGAHLHFEVTVDGVAKDPLDYIDAHNPRPGAAGCTGNYDASFSGVCRALKDRGLSDVATAALLGNMYIETGWTFDPSTNGADGNHGWSYGLVQWHNVAGCDAYDVCNHPVYDGFFCQGSDMQCYCRNQGSSWDTVECQVDYLLKEINENKRYYNIIYGSQDVANMANSFCSTYEVAQDCYKGRWSEPRTSNAVRFLPMVQNGCK